jgi:hypothetical protein
MAKTPHPTPHLGSYTRALLVCQNRRHHFVTSYPEPNHMNTVLHDIYIKRNRLNMRYRMNITIRNYYSSP